MEDRGRGPYRVAVVEVRDDRVEEIAVGDVRVGEIEAIGVRDRFEFELDEGQVVFLEGVQGACENGLVRWRLDGPNGTGETDICTDLGQFTAGPDGTYELVVRGMEDRGTGPYRFAVRPG
jgi:hypothetical protein